MYIIDESTTKRRALNTVFVIGSSTNPALAKVHYAFSPFVVCAPFR